VLILSMMLMSSGESFCHQGGEIQAHFPKNLALMPDDVDAIIPEGTTPLHAAQLPF